MTAPRWSLALGDRDGPARPRFSDAQLVGTPSNEPARQAAMERRRTAVNAITTAWQWEAAFECLGEVSDLLFGLGVHDSTPCLFEALSETAVDYRVLA